MKKKSEKDYSLMEKAKKNIEIMKKKPENEEEKKKKIIFLLLLFVPVFFLFFSAITIVLVPQVREAVEETWVNTWKQDAPTAPEITGGGTDWASKRIISVKKNAYSYYGIEYYEACVTTSNSSKNCTFQRTDTKNIVVSKTGKYNVYFRGVSTKGTKGALSKKEVAYIDNESPIIENLSIEELTDTSAKVKVMAKDLESGIKTYQYKVNNGNWIESKATIDIKDLKRETKYDLEIQIIDQVGNQAIGKISIETLKKDTTEDKDNETEEETNEELTSPTYKVSPSEDKWSSYKIVEIIYPSGVEKEYSLDSGKTWKEYNGPIKFIEDGTIIGRSKKKDKTKEAEELEIKFIDPEMPKISLDKVPLVIEETDRYSLPSSYQFGKSGGEKICYTNDKKEVTNTETLEIGIHTITCEARGNNGLTATTSKTIEVVAKEVDTTWDGWITMTLFYPSNSTDREWRLGDPNSIRPGSGNTSWNPYLGSITVKIEDVQNVYIRYKLGGETVTIPPAGRLLVDIEPKDYFVIQGNETEVKINYDKSAEVKEYKIGNGSWKTYNGSFKVGENTQVEARASKKETIYDNDGNVVLKRTITGTDAIYVGEYVPPTGGSGGSGGSGPNSPTGGNGPSSGNGGSYPSIDFPNNNKPSYYLDGPDITITPTSQTTGEVTVTITTQDQARDIYYKEGSSGSYKKYTTPIKVSQNTTIYAYYVRDSDGMTSATSTKVIHNIYIPGRPYVRIDADPYPNYGTGLSKSVEVEITGSDYQSLEYSYDGVNYQNYNGKFTVTSNCRIYARGTNAIGTTIQTLDITNIGSNGIINPPLKPITLKVNVIANPDNSSTLIDETEVMIQYDSKSTNQTYQVGNGMIQAYTGPFQVTSNALITAWAKSNNGTGTDQKQIDFLTTGISAPLIRPNIGNGKTTPSVILDIKYDKNATKKLYRIDGGSYQTYTGPVTLNSNSVIEAYNENSLGQSNRSSYQITNIVPLPPTVIIEHEYYFLLKLNYPSMAKIKEYKWTKQGNWKNYPTDGILLIKSGYKDQVLSGNNFIIKIEDENGNLIDFKGDYYIVTEGFNQIMENVFMRWDTVKPDKPVITPDTTDITKKVEVVITYPKDVVNKEYRIVYTDGTVTGWMNYTNYITMEKNGTIYARGENEAGMYSDEESLKIDNVDEADPTILLSGDFETISKSVPVKVEAADDKKVEIVMWAKGKQTKEYFEEKGITIPNHSTVEIKENGIYTFYVKDKAGRETILYQEVKNIDNIPPIVDIQVLTKTFGIQAEVEMSFGDSIIKEYKIGTSNKVYTAYLGVITVNSMDVLDNNYQNNDGTVSIYARGVDSVGNETVTEEKIKVLDLERPETPVITVNGLGGYPVLTEYGVKTELKTTISFTESENTRNVYSIDDGVTWVEYKSEFELPSTVTKVMAKSIKKDTGLESKVEIKAISNALPKDAIGPAAYDGDSVTAELLPINERTFRYIMIDESMWEKQVNLYSSAYLSADEYRVAFLTEKGGTKLQEIGVSISKTPTNSKITIPKNTKYIELDTWYQVNNHPNYSVYMNEISVANMPTISVEKKYPEIDEYGVTPGYNIVSINYFSTSVQKLYRIGTEGDWNKYEENEIRVEIGETLYAKGIDKNGVETNISSITSILPSDAVGPSSYDKDNSTAELLPINERTYRYMYIDESMWGKQINLYSSAYLSASSYVVKCMNGKGGTLLQTTSLNISKTPTNGKVTIPKNTNYLLIYTWYTINGHPNYSVYVNEISVVNPTPRASLMLPKQIIRPFPPKVFSNTNNWSVEKILTIDYGTTGQRKEYSLDLGKTWLEYNGPITTKEKATVLTRIMDNGKVISSSSYKVTKIDNTIPMISLDLLPNSIIVGDNYSLPSSYTVDNTKSGGKAICKINDGEYTTTKDLLAGKYTIMCTVTTGAGLTNTMSKQIEVINKQEEQKKEEPIPSSSPDSSENIAQPEPTPIEEKNNTTTETTE